MRTTECMKESGKKTNDMEEVMKGTQMETCMKVTFSKVRLTGKASIIGKMQMKYMMENGQKD